MLTVSITSITSIDDPRLRFIHTLYLESFPASERRPWEDIKELIYLNSPYYNLYVATVDNNFIGFISLWNLPGSTYIEHFAICPEYQSKGFGGQILDKIVADAQNRPVVLEVELPETNDMALKRISFYERHGFKALRDFLYFQPPYAKGLPDVQLMLMSTLPIDDLESFVIILHTLVYNQ